MVISIVKRQRETRNDNRKDTARALRTRRPECLLRWMKAVFAVLKIAWAVLECLERAQCFFLSYGMQRFSAKQPGTKNTFEMWLDEVSH